MIPQLTFISLLDITKLIVTFGMYYGLALDAHIVGCVFKQKQLNEFFVRTGCDVRVEGLAFWLKIHMHAFTK